MHGAGKIARDIGPERENKRRAVTVNVLAALAIVVAGCLLANALTAGIIALLIKGM